MSQRVQDIINEKDKEKKTEMLIKLAQESIEEFFEYLEVTGAFDHLKTNELSKILEVDDPNNLIVGLCLYLSKKSDCGKNLDALTHAEQVIYLAQKFEQELFSGGLSYFYLESSGNNCNETFEAIKETNCPELSALIDKANKLLGNNFPKDEDERNEILLEVMTDEVNVELDKIETEIYKIIDSKENPYINLIYNYYLAHKDEIKK